MANPERSVVPIHPATRAVEHSEEEWTAFKATYGKGLTDAQFLVFRASARHLGLDPFARQITCWREGEGITLYTTIDGLRTVAARTGRLVAQYGPMWCGPDAKWVDAWIADEPPTAARFGVKVAGQEEPVWGVARFKSYSKQGSVWARYPDVMIAKVAESLALRRAFPNETSGLYSDVELTSVGETEALPQPEADNADDETGTAPPETPAQESAATLPHDPDWRSLRALMRAAGITTQKQADALCRVACGKPWAEASTPDDWGRIQQALWRVQAKQAGMAEQEALAVGEAEQTAVAGAEGEAGQHAD